MDCTLQLQCAKLGFFFELSKKKVGKSSKNVDFPKKRLKYLCNSKNSCTFAADLKKSPAKSGVEQLVARQAHNLEVARSNPASATTAAGRLLFFVATPEF